MVFDEAWEVAKSQFTLLEDETSAGTHWHNPFDYKYRVPIGYNPDGSLRYSPRDRSVRVGPEDGVHYPTSTIHLQNFEFPDSDDPEQRVVRPRSSGLPGTELRLKRNLSDYDPDIQDQRALEQIISTIIHENIHDAYTEGGWSSILGGYFGDTPGREGRGIHGGGLDQMGEAPDEEFPGKIGDVNADERRSMGFGMDTPSESRPLPARMKIVPGMGRTYETERLPNERSAYVGMFPRLRGFPRYRTITHSQVPISESDLVLDDIIAARKRSGAFDREDDMVRSRGIVRPRAPEIMRDDAKRGRRSGRKKSRGFARGIHEESPILFDQDTGLVIRDPDTDKPIPNPRKGLPLSYLSEQESEASRGFAIEPQEQILNNLLNAINQSVYTRMANSGEFFEDESIPLQTRDYNIVDTMRPLGAKQTLGGRSKAVANETKDVRRLLNAHFKKVRQGKEPLPTRMTDLPQNIREEIGRIQLREMLGEERGRTGIMDIEGVRNPLGAALLEANEAMSDSRPDNLNYIVAAEMNNEMYNRLDDKISELTKKKLGVNPKEPTPMGLWDEYREIKENDPEIRALIDKRDEIHRKTMNYPGYSDYRDSVMPAGRIPRDMSRSEWREERKRLADAILANTTGLDPAESRSKKMGYDLDSQDGSTDRVFMNIIKPELEARGYKFDTDEHPYDVEQEMKELFGGVFDPEGWSQYDDKTDGTVYPKLMSRFGSPMIGVRGKVKPQRRLFGNLTQEVLDKLNAMGNEE